MKQNDFIRGFSTSAAFVALGIHDTKAFSLSAQIYVATNYPIN